MAVQDKEEREFTRLNFAKQNFGGSFYHVPKYLARPAGID